MAQHVPFVFTLFWMSFASEKLEISDGGHLKKTGRRPGEFEAQHAAPYRECFTSFQKLGSVSGKAGIERSGAVGLAIAIACLPAFSGA